MSSVTPNRRKLQFELELAIEGDVDFETICVHSV